MRLISGTRRRGSEQLLSSWSYRILLTEICTVFTFLYFYLSVVSIYLVVCLQYSSIFTVLTGSIYMVWRFSKLTMLHVFWIGKRHLRPLYVEMHFERFFLESVFCNKKIEKWPFSCLKMFFLDVSHIGCKKYNFYLCWFQKCKCSLVTKCSPIKSWNLLNEKMGLSQSFFFLKGNVQRKTKVGSKITSIVGYWPRTVALGII